MATFTYKARNWDGKIVSAEMEGESKEVCISKLREKGYFVTQISEKKGGGGGIPGLNWEKSVSSQSVSVFARQFSTMISSGVPLVRCLTILQSQEENSTFKRIIGQIRTDVEGGATLSKALEKHPKVFDDFFCSLIKAGELGGILDTILARLADSLEGSENLKAKVKGALTYPVVIFIIACLVVVGLIVFVLPQFKEIFEGMNVELPWITTTLLNTSDIFTEWWFVIFPVMFAIPVLIISFFKTKTGQRFYDVNILRLPAVGMMMRKVSVAKFTRTLGTLISSGVPILQALEVTSQTAGNCVIADAVDKTRVSIREGESIADPLKQSGVFPPMVVQMIAVGEETGELDKMLIKIADFYDTEVDAAVKGLTSVIEPIVIVFMGVVVGGIVMAVFMPMLKLVNAN